MNFPSPNQLNTKSIKRDGFSVRTNNTQAVDKVSQLLYVCFLLNLRAVHPTAVQFDLLKDRDDFVGRARPQS
jgi:hypothetical protein